MVDMATAASINQYAVLVVKPALMAIHAYSYNALVLITGTAFTETHLHYLHQLHGPATGFLQIEPKTYHDIYANFLPHKPQLKENLSKLGRSYDQLVYQLKYAAAIARIVYMRHSDVLPHINAHDMALSYKQNFNTYHGKASIIKATQDFQTVIDALKRHGYPKH